MQVCHQSLSASPAQSWPSLSVQAAVWNFSWADSPVHFVASKLQTAWPCVADWFLTPQLWQSVFTVVLNAGGRVIIALKQLGRFCWGQGTDHRLDQSEHVIVCLKKRGHKYIEEELKGVRNIPHFEANNLLTYSSSLIPVRHETTRQTQEYIKC